MKIKTYLKHKEIFELRYKQAVIKDLDKGFFGINLHDLKYGIRNFSVFLNIYAFDKKPTFSNIVNSIDRRARFYIKQQNRPVLKIKIDFTKKSMLQYSSYKDTYERFLLYLNIPYKP